LLLTRDVLDEIRAGRITVVFRCWKRPTVRTGGTLRTAVGVLAIDAVEPVALADVGQADARRAGFASRAELIAQLRQPPESRLYRIALHWQGADPRIALRQQGRPSADELATLQRRLERLDAASRRGAWTGRVLHRLAEKPGVRAADLAAELGLETLPFKADVRKLKELGLTESLEVGYRLSPRGRALLRRLAR